jgi:hypothetical protein
MLGHFPTPHDDELFYSLCARYGSRVSYPSAKSLLLDIFNAASACAVVDLPNRLRCFTDALPTGSFLTVDRLIDQHTLFPFFSAFLPPERVGRIRKDMRFSTGPAAHMRSGLMASSVPTPGWLRCCPLCWQEDIKAFGETYWHRLHQLPGIEVCPLHQIFFENSCVGIRSRRDCLQFVAADQEIHTVSVRPIQSENRDHKQLLNIAKAAAWLLEHPHRGESLKALQNRYLQLLFKRKLAAFLGGIRAEKLIAEFTDYYSPELLKFLHCELSGKEWRKCNWLLRLVRDPKHAQHPIHHLLLIHFLGCSVKEFLELPKDLNFFGEGPWPCLNPAAKHFRQLVIPGHKLSSRARDNRPVARFTCKCGFAYARSGPDSSQSDMFRIGRMISFGRTWENKLEELWNSDSQFNLSQIGRRLGVEPLTVRRHATRLKLSFSTAGRRMELNSRSKLKCAAGAGKRKIRMDRKAFRTKWLFAINQNNEITMSALRKTLPKAYSWRTRNDSDWLQRNKPKPTPHKTVASVVDWKSRDSRFAVLVKESADQIRFARGRPVRITKTVIGRDLGLVSLFQQHQRKIPFTSRMLESVVENWEEFAIRRIWWAADCYLREHVLPQQWQLVLRANVYRNRETLGIKRAIQSALKMLGAQLSLPRLATA